MIDLHIPVLTTPRLTLRGPAPEDFEPIVAFYASKERSWGFGGPMTRHQSWRWFATSIGHWVLNGYGFWTVVERDSGRVVGIVGLWCPDGWPEPELGWVMFEGSEGRGYAREAAEEVRRHAYDSLGFTTLTSNIFPGNDRSIALAERLGATFERSFESVSHGTELQYRHPAPAALREGRE